MGFTILRPSAAPRDARRRRRGLRALGAARRAALRGAPLGLAAAALLAGAAPLAAAWPTPSRAAAPSPPPAAAGSPPSAPAAAAQPPATADLVVDRDDGTLLVYRVPVAAGATGLDLLTASGADVQTSGGAVCRIDGLGCPPSNCFCACTDLDACAFWSYHHGVGDGGWATAAEGPAEWVLPPAAREGWVWGGGRPPVTATAATRAVQLGFGWLRGAQGPDGGLGAPGLTVEGILAARAAGADVTAWHTAGRSPLSDLAATGRAYVALGAAQAGKLVAGLSAAGADPRAFAAEDWVARLMATYDPATGRFGASNWDQAWAILGLVAAREPVPPAAREALAAARAADGGWGGVPGGAASDTDSTGLVLQALAAAGAPVTSTAVTEGLDHLARTRRPGGGWGHEPGAADDNVNSTAYALQALAAFGEDPGAGPWASGGGGPIDALVASQRPEGRFGYDVAPADLVATLQVLPAVAGRPLGAVGRGAALRDGVAWIRAHQAADGSFEGFNPGATIEAVLALAAAGARADVAAPGGATASAYLEAVAAEYAARGPSAAGKLLVGVAALGADPRAFGGLDLVAALEGAYDPATGQFGAGGTWDQAWALLGLRAAGRSAPSAALEALRAIASPEGGWGFEAAAATADVDATALALAALGRASSPALTPAVRAGIGALRARQRPEGGFAGFDGATSATSTGLAIAGLVAVDQRPDGPAWQADAPGRPGPRDALVALQSPAGGFAGFAGPDDPGATYAAVLGLTGRGLPARRARDGRTVHLPLLLAGR